MQLVRPVLAARGTSTRGCSRNAGRSRRSSPRVPSPAAFEYIFEDDVALHRTVPEASLMPLVRAESALSSAPLLYLGSCKTYDAGTTARLVVDGERWALEMRGLVHARGRRAHVRRPLVAAIRTALGARWSVAMDQNLFRWTGSDLRAVNRRASAAPSRCRRQGAAAASSTEWGAFASTIKVSWGIT